MAVSGTVLAVLFAGGIAQPGWSAGQTAQFERAVTIGGLALTAMAGALVAWAYFRARSV